MKTLSSCPLRYCKPLWRWLWFALLLCSSLRIAAHEIPDDVKLTSLARVEGGQWVLMVRAPLAAMTEADLPLRGPYLDMDRAAPALQVAARLWFVDRFRVLADGQPIGPAQLSHVRVSLASDRSFDTWERAQALLMGAPPETATDLVWKQQYLDARLVFTLPAPAARIAVDFDAARMGGRVSHTLRYQTASGIERLLQLHGDTGFVSLEPGAWESIRRFAIDGLLHILSGIDHLLFLGCLLLGAASLRSLIWTVTGFTVAHSITLVSAATGWAPAGLWFAPAVEWAIAASIVVAAIDAVLWPARPQRWIMASGFGLIHGLGFSFALRDSLPFAGDHVVLALASFNLGVELGQVLILLPAWPLLSRLRQLEPLRERTQWLHAMLALLIAHTAWHWMSERWGAVSKFTQAADWAALLAAAVESPLLWGALALLAGWQWVSRVRR